MLIIGIGQPWRGDDAAGLAVLDLLSDLPCRQHHGEGLGLMALWEEAPAVMVIDATQSGAPPGTLHRLTAADLLLNDGGNLFRSSSHAFGVHQAVRTAHALGRLPPRLVLYGIEGAAWTLGAGLSPAVAAALPELARRVRAEAAGKSDLAPCSGA